IVSMSASVGTTSRTRPRSAATAAKSAFAGAVNPDTRGAGTPSRRRLAADFRRERSVSELEVYDGTGRGLLTARTFYSSDRPQDRQTRTAERFRRRIGGIHM